MSKLLRLLVLGQFQDCQVRQLAVMSLGLVVNQAVMEEAFVFIDLTKRNGGSIISRQAKPKPLWTGG